MRKGHFHSAELNEGIQKQRSEKDKWTSTMEPRGDEEEMEAAAGHFTLFTTSQTCKEPLS